MRLTIKTKLVAAFAVLIALLGASSFFALREAASLETEIDKMAIRRVTQLQEHAFDLKADGRALNER